MEMMRQKAEKRKSLDHGGYKNCEIYGINSAVKNHNATENKKQHEYKHTPLSCQHLNLKYPL